MENGGYLLAAFAVVWAAVFAFVLVLIGRQKRLEREIESVKESAREKTPR